MDSRKRMGKDKVTSQKNDFSSWSYRPYNEILPDLYFCLDVYKRQMEALVAVLY